MSERERQSIGGIDVATVNKPLLENLEFRFTRFEAWVIADDEVPAP